MGIERMGSRIADIQSRMIALQTQQAGRNVQQQGVKPASGAEGGTFANALEDAVAQTSTSNKSYSLNSKGIPTDLAGYGNGRIPASALEQVGNTRHKLWAPAAQSLNQMIGDAKKDGVHIGITDSYRPYAEQVDLVRRKGLYSQGGLAAKPGTSEHGWGMATDLDLNSKALAWMKQNGEKYGFEMNVPRENWHWAYKPKSL
ncbi:M15 family metallopeptidase [Paractinoplanes hotanensis]|uniref:M15 family metallopeptidase n=1 Tax=Paractinoplanes hotanensis TaxID=2906497 RepID=A0ABT0YG08_9ACTN|nr:M15 family metallopeptidase [Actinoplanes hotanensis]MCM4084986.1 M15 family metallopeptidase [Actinoplanes hotanensis]